MVKEVKPKKVVTKKPRTDKRRNVGKVAEVLVKNPNKTEQEIADETGLGAGTVHRAKKELEENGVKDPTINFIVGYAKDNLKDLAKLQRAKIKNMVKEYIIEDKDGNVEIIKDKEMNMKDLEMMSKMGKDYMSQITVLGGDITKPDGGLKEVIDDDKLKAIQSLANSFGVKN